MFFIGIMGVDGKEKDVKIINSLPCKNCEEEPSGKLIKTFNYFHIFFIPIFRWNEKYYIICNGCNSIYEISKEKGKRLESGEDNTVTYWDLKVVKNSIRKCNKCGTMVEPEFTYCPHCGEKLD